MKQLLLIFYILGIGKIVFGQTNTFPSSGNVGIGNTSPDNLLTVGSASTRGTIGVVGTSSEVPVITWIDPRTNGHSYSLYNGLSVPGNFDILDQNTSEYRLSINAAGNAGIGIVNPIFKMQVESKVPGVAKFGTSATGTTGNISVLNASNYNYGVLGVISGTNTVGGDVFGLGYSSDANSSFNDVISWTSTGKVGIGTTLPTEALAVNGKIRAKEINVETGWADFVFKPEYNLRSLRETEQFIKENGHLPEIPSAKEVEANGINLGEMNSKLLQKIEELTLHLIEQDKKFNKKISDLEKQIADRK